MAKFKTLEDEDIEYLHFAGGVYNDSNMPVPNDAMVLAYDAIRCKGHTICWVIDKVADLIGTRYVLQALCYNKYLANGDRIYAIEYDYNPNSYLDYQVKYVCEVYNVNQLYSYVSSCANKRVTLTECKGLKCETVPIGRLPTELSEVRGSDLPVALIDIPPDYAFDSRTFYELRMRAGYNNSLYNNNRPRRSNIPSPEPISVEPKYKWKLWFGLSGVGLTEDDQVVELSRTFQDYITEFRSLYSTTTCQDIEDIKRRVDEFYQLSEQPVLNEREDNTASTNSAFLSLIDQTLEILGG